MPPGQDVMISVYNIHHSPAVWDDPEAFKPERFPLDEPVPTEANTDYRHAALDFLFLTTLADGTLHKSLSVCLQLGRQPCQGVAHRPTVARARPKVCGIAASGVSSALQHSGASF